MTGRCTDDRICIVRDLLGEFATDAVIQWLENIGYFEAPAARKYHGNYRGGLADHSIAVAKQLRMLTDKLGLKWQREKSPEIVGLLHDICKTDDYTWSFKSTVGDTIQWNDSQIVSGHGDKSVLMISGHFNLTPEETQCILFHMGSFTEKDQWQYYSKAVSKNQNVLYTHTADMLASQVSGV